MSLSLNNVLNQLIQIFSEPITDPTSNQLRKIDRGIFITPYPIKKSAFDSAISRISELERREITIIDGPLLVDQVMKFIPETVENFSADLRYRMQLAESVNRISESRAFGISNDLILDQIYVDLSLGPRGLDLSKIATLNSGISIDSIVVSASPKALNDLKSVFRRFAPSASAYLEPPSSSKEMMRKKEESKLQKQIKKLEMKIIQSKIDSEKRKLKENLEVLKNCRIIEVNISPILNALQKKSISFITEFNLNRYSQDSSIFTKTIRKGIKTHNEISLIDTSTIIKEHLINYLEIFFDKMNNISEEYLAVESLLKIDHAIFLRGAPGAGKTTILRRLSKQVADSHKNEFPILLYLIKTNKIQSHEQLIYECLNELKRLGLSFSKNEFIDIVRNNKCRIFLDGLDELGINADICFKAIQDFCTTYPDCPLIVTARDTINYSKWDSALNINIKPFNDEQLWLFVNNWFTAEPSGHHEICRWLNENESMRNLARTPLIAALLCALYHAGADMPTTEVELYEQRFELLLGKWEKAKGIPFLPTEIRKRMSLFLMKLAFEIHKANIRSMDFKKVVCLATDFFSKGFYNSPEMMVKDCIQRHLLLMLETGEISFGHLTFQEFMAAKYLSHVNPLEFIWQNIDKKWWFKSINYYAYLKGDISILIESKRPKGLRGIKKGRLKELIKLANLTSPVVIKNYGLY
jgi:Cdc6-like AAA superfamily ATPase